MFGKNVSQIVEGHYNEIANKENELYETRIAICKECPLCSNTPTGPVCSSKLCWDKLELKLVPAPGRGVVCGCGCRLNAKTRVKYAKCVLDKWPK